LRRRGPRINLEGGNLRLGALARMSDVSANPEIQHNYPVVADALKLAASRNCRNMATLGGNVLHAHAVQLFSRRQLRQLQQAQPGSGCAALQGFNRTHAVLGTSEQCIATYPGDFAQALIALDAAVESPENQASGRFRSPAARVVSICGEIPGGLCNWRTEPSGTPDFPVISTVASSAIKACAKSPG